MVSAKALCYQDKILPLLELGGEHPAAVRLFGSDPCTMEQAAGIAARSRGGHSGYQYGLSGAQGGQLRGWLLMRTRAVAVKVAGHRGRADGPSSNSG